MPLSLPVLLKLLWQFLLLYYLIETRNIKKYTIAPNKNSVVASFKITQNIKAGEYIIALSILDPAGNLPCVRFNIQNYFKGGRHPMGKIGVGKKIQNTELNAAGFDDLYSDLSLHYEFNILSE